MTTTTRLKKLAGKALLSTIVGAALAACGGGGGSSTPVGVTQPLSVQVTATSVAALTAAGATGFTFSNGVNELYTSGTPTTITFAAPTGSQTKPTFALAYGGNIATGTLAFGSCDFTIDSINPNNNTNPLFSYLNTTIKVPTCEAELNFSNTLANGTSSSVGTTFTLGTDTSGSTPITVTVQTDGTVLVDNQVVGTATVQVITGGSS